MADAEAGVRVLVVDSDGTRADQIVTRIGK